MAKNAETMSLNELYDGDLPDRDEMIWSFISHDEADKQLTIITIDPVVAYETWVVDDGSTTVKEAFRDHAQPWQKKLVASYRKDMHLADTIIVVAGELVVDGYHRIAALAKNKVRAVRALDLEEPA